jgi:hypothetical protein
MVQRHILIIQSHVRDLEKTAKEIQEIVEHVTRARWVLCTDALKTILGFVCPQDRKDG